MKYKNSRKQKLTQWCTELIGQSKYDQKCMKVHQKHTNVTQNMHGARRNYRYVWDVSGWHANPFASRYFIKHEVRLYRYPHDQLINHYTNYPHISCFVLFSFMYSVSHVIYSQCIQPDVGGYIIPRGPKEYISWEGGASPNLNHQVPRHTFECEWSKPL